MSAGRQIVGMNDRLEPLAIGATTIPEKATATTAALRTRRCFMSFPLVALVFDCASSS